MSDNDSGSECDSTHTPDSLDDSPDHPGWQPETIAPEIRIATNRPEPATASLDPLATDDG